MDDGYRRDHEREERRTGKQMEEEKEVEGWGGGQVWCGYGFCPETIIFTSPSPEGLGGRFKEKDTS